MKCPKCNNEYDLCDIVSIDSWPDREALLRCPKCASFSIVIDISTKDFSKRKIVGKIIKE